MKKFYQTAALIVPMFCLLNGPPAFAENNDEMEAIKQQLKTLITQNQNLSKRIAEMEQKQEKQTKPEISQNSDQSETAPDQVTSRIGEYISFNGAIEVEASWSEDFDNESTSSIDLATAEFAFEAHVVDWATGLMAIEWDDEEDKLHIDEAFINIHNTGETPAFLQAGRFIVPFGLYEGNTISDPLTKEAFETKENAAMVGLEFNGFYTNAYVFNGDTNEGGGDDTIKQFGANLGYRLENDDMIFDTSIDFINSVFDADGLTDGFPDSLESDYSPGVAVHATVNVYGIGLIAEYITATDEVDGVEPAAWQLEGFYETELANHGVIFSLGYSGTDNLGSTLPESRIAAILGVTLFEGGALTFEYAHDKDYSIDEGGTDETADTFTTQLAYEF